MFNAKQRGHKRNNNASIRDNFDEFSDEESEDDTKSAMTVPGPGSYIRDLNTFGKSTSKAESF